MSRVQGTCHQVGEALEGDRHGEYSQHERRPRDILGVELTAAEHGPYHEPAHDQQDQRRSDRQNPDRGEVDAEDPRKAAPVAGRIGRGHGREGRDREAHADEAHGQCLEAAPVAHRGHGARLEG